MFYILVKSHSGHPLKLFSDTVTDCLLVGARYPGFDYRVYSFYGSSIVYDEALL